MARDRTASERPRRTYRVVDAVARRLESTFRPFVGGAQVGGPMTPAPERRDFVCSLCGRPFSEHRHGKGPDGRLYCPPAAAGPAGTPTS